MKTRAKLISLLISFLFPFNLFKFSYGNDFPPDFLFGASTSAYQVEGAWNAEGKGENIWDRLTHTCPELIFDGQTGDVACDSYYQYKEDVKLIKGAGFNLYRFSISWARILPEGKGSEINKDGIKYYNSLIDELLNNNIQPMITIYHWDLPQALQDEGGWLNTSIIQHMANYADILFYYFGDKVKWWITINEPNAIVTTYSGGYFTPNVHQNTENNFIIVAHNIVRVHAKIYRLYEKKYKTSQNGKVSISLNSNYCAPKTSSADDRMAAEIYFQFNTGIFANPIYSNEADYPKLLRELITARSQLTERNSPMPNFTNEEKQEIKVKNVIILWGFLNYSVISMYITYSGAYDFYALNHYSSSICSKLPQNVSSTNFYGVDVNMKCEADPKWSVAPGTKWLYVFPEGFREILKLIKMKYNNPPIFVTENGYGDLGGIEDKERISYHKKYMSQMLNAKNENGCNIIGYTVWSIIDNFEWTSGFRTKFGLTYVDFNDTKKTRIPKSSYYFFKALINNRTIPK